MHEAISAYQRLLDDYPYYDQSYKQIGMLLTFTGPSGAGNPDVRDGDQAQSEEFGQSGPVPRSGLRVPDARNG